MRLTPSEKPTKTKPNVENNEIAILRPAHQYAIGSPFFVYLIPLLQKIVEVNPHFYPDLLLSASEEWFFNWMISFQTLNELLIPMSRDIISSHLTFISSL